MTVYIGIDWSECKHDVVCLNDAGAIVARQTIAHNPQGLAQIEVLCQQLGVAPSACLVGLETAHNLLVDYLWARGFSQVYVIPPGVVSASRGRYGASLAHDDARDARLLADLLRTDRALLQPWQPDSPLTRQIRAKVGLVEHLTGSKIRVENRLRAVLLRYYPAALDLFGGLSSLTTLSFIAEFNTPQALDELTYADFVAFAAQHRYYNRQGLLGSYARLQQPRLVADPAVVLAYQDEAALLAGQLLELCRAKQRCLAGLQLLFAQHPDQAIFASLPGTGAFLAPALLAKFSDDRRRFPSPASLQAVAATSPVTKASGKSKQVLFRRACDREFRQIVQQWARCSLRHSVWANAYWQQVRPHAHSPHDAYRRLAHRWLAVAWKLWQSGETYSESYHLQQRWLRSLPRA